GGRLLDRGQQVFAKASHAGSEDYARVPATDGAAASLRRTVSHGTPRASSVLAAPPSGRHTSESRRCSGPRWPSPRLSVSRSESSRQVRASGETPVARAASAVASELSETAFSSSAAVGTS